MSGTMLSTLRRTDEKKTITYVVSLFSKLNDSFSLNPEKKLNASQLFDLAVDVLEVYGYETIEDIALICKMVRQGNLGGTVYGIDIHTVLKKWFPEYLELKAIEREKEHQKTKEEPKEPLTLEQVRYFYEKQGIEHYIDQLTRYYDLQMLEDTIKSFSKDERYKIYLPYLKKRRLTIK